MNAEKAENVSLDWVRTFQRKLYQAAKQNARRRFGILYDKVYREEVLREAWRRVARNGGSAGVDGQSIEQIEQSGAEEFLLELQQELAEQRYGAAAIRRVYIPKGDGRQRPLGIPTVKDREAYSKRQGRLVRVKYPRAKSVRGIQQRIKATIQAVGLGEEFSEVITAVNRKLRGWANYFRIGNRYAAALGLNEYVCEQLRIWWRRRKQRKPTRGGREWANALFYRQGLEYLPALVRGGANAA